MSKQDPFHNPTDTALVIEAVDPIEAGGPIRIKPEFFRLPKAGERDPHFGLSRSFYYEVEARGLLKLVRIRKRGHLRGVTLIPYDRVLAHINSQNG